MSEILTVMLDDSRLSDWERHVLAGIAARMRDAAAVAAESAVEAERPKIRPNRWLGDRPRMTPSWMTR